MFDSDTQFKYFVWDSWIDELTERCYMIYEIVYENGYSQIFLLDEEILL